MDDCSALGLTTESVVEGLVGRIVIPGTYVTATDGLGIGSSVSGTGENMAKSGVGESSRPGLVKMVSDGFLDGAGVVLKKSGVAAGSGL